MRRSDYDEKSFSLCDDILLEYSEAGVCSECEL